MNVHVLLYDAGKDSEGIHSLELAGKTVVLMFENSDDANRYAGLLEAQDFPLPSVQALNKDEVESFCQQAGYEAEFVESGFVPKNEEEILLLTPPQSNRDVTNWKDQLTDEISSETNVDDSDKLSDIRKRLEDLL